MGISYLKHRSWANWSRDERFFCAVLFEYARKDPGAFARYLITQARCPFDLSKRPLKLSQDETGILDMKSASTVTSSGHPKRLPARMGILQKGHLTFAFLAKRLSSS